MPYIVHILLISNKKHVNDNPIMDALNPEVTHDTGQDPGYEEPGQRGDPLETG